MDLLVGLLVLIVIAGAILGGKGFGDTVRKGCGCLVIALLALIVLVVLFFRSGYNSNDKKQQEREEKRVVYGR